MCIKIFHEAALLPSINDQIVSCITWTLNSNIVRMTTVESSNANPTVRTIQQIDLISSAVRMTKPHGTTSLPIKGTHTWNRACKEVIASWLYSLSLLKIILSLTKGRIPQLPTCHCCISTVPVSVTDCSPPAFNTDLYPALTCTKSSPQTNGSVFTFSAKS